MQDLHTKCGGLKTEDKEVIPIIVKIQSFALFPWSTVHVCSYVQVCMLEHGIYVLKYMYVCGLLLCLVVCITAS